MKVFYLQDNIGRAKYTVSYHDGQSRHNDGSDFYAIRIFRNKKSLAGFVEVLRRDGYQNRTGVIVSDRMAGICPVK